MTKSEDLSTIEIGSNPLIIEVQDKARELTEAIKAAKKGGYDVVATLDGGKLTIAAQRTEQVKISADL